MINFLKALTDTIVTSIQYSIGITIGGLIGILVLGTIVTIIVKGASKCISYFTKKKV